MAASLTATLALLGWPLVAAWLFSTLPRERAIIWSVVASYLLLPSGTAIDLPGVPGLDKVSLPNLVMLVLVLATSKDKVVLMPQNRLAKVLLVMIVLGPFVTALSNPDPLIFEQAWVPGMSFYDAFAGVVQTLLIMAPFLIGRSCLGTKLAHRELLKAFVVAALFYSVPILLEVRLSPQLHNWIYGYHPHLFHQQMRGGGFRPMVFIGHGLLVAFFVMVTVTSAAILWRWARERQEQARERQEQDGDPGEKSTGYYLGCLIWLMLMLVLCKSLGSLIYALFLVPLIMFTSRRLQLLIASVLVLIALTYPMLRGAGLVPTGDILEMAESINEERARSLEFRFTNEEVLLERSNERPLFGWGTWGRNHLRDPVTGELTTVTDGYWIIVIGIYGWAGYIATFGLLVLPVIVIFQCARRESVDILTAGLALLLAINIIELLPNATLSPYTWLIAGSLLGYAERARTATVSDTPVKVPTRRRPRTIL